MKISSAWSGAISAELVRLKQEYNLRGYVAVPCVFSSAELEAWSQEVERLWSLPEVEDPDSFRVDWRATESGNTVAERLDPVTDISPLFFRLARDERILTLASHLLGDEAILFKDKLIIKPSGAIGYPLHQDFAYVESLGFEGSQQLAVCIAIDMTADAAGPIEFFPFQHHRRLPSPHGRPGETDERLLDMKTGEILRMESGDMVIFSSLCPHRSAPNRSMGCRRLLFLTYNARSTGDLYDTYYRLGKP